MERSSAAVGAVRRLRTQQPPQQHQSQQLQKSRRRRPPPKEEEGWDWKKVGGGSSARLLLLPESRAVLVLLLYLLGLRGLVHVSFQQLVQPARDPKEFNAPRARMYLENITAIGPRAVGSPENEIFTVNYLLEQIKAIELKSSHAHKISVDIQRPTGTFSIDFLGGFTSYYDNITNVVVKLEPRSGAEHAVLSNCHFDSVPNTIASDFLKACLHNLGTATAEALLCHVLTSHVCESNRTERKAFLKDLKTWGSSHREKCKMIVTVASWTTKQ